jgi:hypothetical protein
MANAPVGPGSVVVAIGAASIVMVAALIGQLSGAAAPTGLTFTAGAATLAMPVASTHRLESVDTARAAT